MEPGLEFPDLLRLIDERSTAFRAAVAAAPSLDLPVPACPGWTLRDLVQHLGRGQRSWGATVDAGPGASAKSTSVDDAPGEREALLAWSAASTQILVDALREAGPDRGCWTWWGDSHSPQTSGAVARHQVQEATVHTYDAQLAVGDAQPLPSAVARDGVEEFLFTCCATTSPWPHEPAAVDYHATEGGSWRLWLDAGGARVARISEDADGEAAASARATAGELVLVFYGRLPLAALQPQGDARIFDQLIAWEPE